MLNCRFAVCSLLMILLVTAASSAQRESHSANVEDTASPEMQRLARAFVGDWDTTETMERNQYFPNGGGRRGLSHWRLGGGGSTLIGEGHSDGSAGPLDHLIIIWWNPQTKSYGYFVCFKDTGSGCKIRGSAHWEGENFVNDYEEMEHGKSVKWRDSFVEITPRSHILIAARDNGDGTWKKLITSKSMRR